MHRKLIIAAVALSLGGGLVLPPSLASAQPGQSQLQKKMQGQPRGGRNVFAPRGGARAFSAPAARTFSPRAPRTFTSRPAQAFAPRMVAPRIAPRVTPRAAARIAPRLVAPSAAVAHVAAAGRLRGMPVRGAGRATIRGRNFSVWRSGYRVRQAGGWTTFVALSTLSAIAIGASRYYPYAYISAPQPYCEGLTEDGCELRWQQVETMQGGAVSQCVAYCPWQ